MKHHDLKCFTEFFKAISNRSKKSDIRKNDRDYQVGDTVTFRDGESVNGEFVYTGFGISARISYIDNFGLQDGYVNLSLSDVGLLIIK